MKGLFRFLGVVADIFIGIRTAIRSWRKERRLKKDEKEEAELEKLISRHLDK